MIGIYKITSPSNKVYIGQSIDILNRFNQYYNLKNCETQPRLFSSFKKYNVDNHIFEIIEECGFEQLNTRERYWQEFYNVIGEDGLNCVLTKTDIKPRFVSKITRKKLRLSRIGKTLSEETKEKIARARNSWVLSEESKKKISDKKSGDKHHFFGKNLSEEHKLKLSESVKNTLSKKDIIFTDTHKKKISKSLKGKPSNRRRLVVDLSTGIFFESLKEASEAYCIKHTTLCMQLKGINKNKTNLIYV